MIPTDRSTFKQFCLRKLGAPVIKINLSEDQIDDCVDQAFYLYQQYHFDATEPMFYKYQMTQTDINNGYIQLPPNIIGVVDIFPVGQSIGTNSLFNMRYQFIINDLYNFSNVSLLPYYTTLAHVQMMEELLVGEKPIRYNRHNNILYLDMDMSVLVQNEYIIVRCTGVIDPTVYNDVWRDKWLQDYAAALMKRQWGENLSVFDAPLPGNVKLNGLKMRDDAYEDMLRLENRLKEDYTYYPQMLIG